MKKVLGIGNALVDVLIRIEDDQLLKTLQIPMGSMQLVDEASANHLLELTANHTKEIASGGSAANTIHGLASLGVPSGYVGKIGNDEYGQIFKNDMVNKSIEPHLLVGDQKTGRAHAMITPNGERTFATFLGAAIELNKNDLDKIPFDKFDMLHIEGYLVQNHELIEKALNLAKRNGLMVSIDMASYNVVEANKNFLQLLIEKYVDIVFANEEESKAFTDLEPEEAVKKIAEITDISIVKVGKNGSMVQDKDRLVMVDAVKATPLDTTGAGDLYAAGFIYGLVNHLPKAKCAEIGSLLGAKVIETLGARLSDANWKDIKNTI